MALPQVSSSSAARGGGDIILSHGEVLFVSSDMSKSISNHLLPPLIEAFAKDEAERNNSMLRRY